MGGELIPEELPGSAGTKSAGSIPRDAGWNMIPR
jgi:hypothetical protein